MIASTPSTEITTRVEIPKSLLEYAERTARYTTPLLRYSGFADGTKRGSGDLSDLIGTLMVFDYLAQNNKVCSFNVTSGSGDDHDLLMRLVDDTQTTWNVKTSSYSPFREGLNLCVKREEIGKPINGYIQVFVHLSDEIPHVHFAGIASAKKVYSQPIVTLPNTGGHEGVMLPLDETMALEEFMHHIKDKF